MATAVHAGAIQTASPNAACLGLPQMSLDTAIWQLLPPPGGHQSNRQTITINKYTYFAGRFDGHGDAPVLNPAHPSMEEVHFTRSHWTLSLGKYCV